MSAHLRANLLLLVLTVLLCSVAYPLVLWGIGQTVFHEKAQGSLVTDASGKPIGSRLIAQPFTADEYFQPRPSAASYNAAASGASNWGANNYLLRDRVARQLGPIVKYRSGPNKGQLVGPDIEAWFQKDQFDGKPGIVAQWASMHSGSGIPQNWVKADKLNTDYVAQWQKSHPEDVAQWIKTHTDVPEPKPEDLAVPFFTSYSKSHPGTFPGAAEHKTADGKTEKTIEPIKEGPDIQAAFFDMWLQSHSDADLEQVPADAVMASGSGLDPDITLVNALWQLDRVAAAWAKKTNSDKTKLHGEIEQLLHEKSHAPLGGLAGVPLVNVLEINLALRDCFEKTTKYGK
ncbi:MAG: potassium-transporting ATPase subunit C [Thermoguttaceae bacterium]|jgi:K+-transporting ATPase ATPase C chain